ncbi:MAG TPA: hypothetical protein VFP71_11280 [Candidatus Angelobacter sp.]|nr:hypothetical protein [Candidatus Angelobacter sp.]
MKCEICKTIERLGLDASAHDLWYCADAPAKKFSLQPVQAHMKQFGRKVHVFFLMKRRQGRMRVLAHYRPRLVTLGI